MHHNLPATANQLNGMGYEVAVFDKNEAPGGLLRYGIPNFTPSSSIIRMRLSMIGLCNLKLGMP